ncbi:porphobilinogen deaminase, partial [Coemansia sp. RSA 2167]
NMLLAAIHGRADPRDCVIMAPRNQGKKLEDLAEGSVIGTGSVRRVAQLRRQYPHLEFADVRGNLNTRLAKLDAPDSVYDALVLAVAGIERLQLGARIAHALDTVLYAVGQGALGVEVRADDVQTRELVACLNSRSVRLECLAEREVMRVLEGGCSVPIGVRSTWDGEQLEVKCIVASPDGSQAVEAGTAAQVTNDDQARALGVQVAALMRERGADAVLKAI